MSQKSVDQMIQQEPTPSTWLARYGGTPVVPGKILCDAQVTSDGILLTQLGDTAVDLLNLAEPAERSVRLRGSPEGAGVRRRGKVKGDGDS
jgi:hypothetical protein